MLNPNAPDSDEEIKAAMETGRMISEAALAIIRETRPAVAAVDLKENAVMAIDPEIYQRLIQYVQDTAGDVDNTRHSVRGGMVTCRCCGVNIPYSRGWKDGDHLGFNGLHDLEHKPDCLWKMIEDQE
jgi:hypothetical protein